MRKSGTFLVMILILFSVFGLPLEKKYDFRDYTATRKHVQNLYTEKQYGEAANVLEWALEEYPDHVMANSYNLALMRVHLKEYEKSAAALQYGIDHGVWYGKYSFFQDLWEPLRNLKSFQAVLAVCEEKMKEKQSGSRAETLVVTPEGYSREKKYPLFIALHGGGGNIEEFRKEWTSDKLKKEFIVLFVQSSQAISMDGYNWTEDIKKAQQEIKEAYEKVISEYPVDSGKVVIGGFSSGGVASLTVALENTFPVAGFIVLCPAKPEAFDRERVEDMKNRGLRGTIMTTEMDGRLDDQIDMADLLEETGFDHHFFVTPNIGHWFPEDMNVRIDQALEHIFS